MLAMAKPEASISRRISLAGSKWANTGAFVNTSQSYAKDRFTAGVGRKGPEKRPFFPPFSMSIIGLARREKLLMNRL
jgi:hypothetical protein